MKYSSPRPADFLKGFLFSFFLLSLLLNSNPSKAQIYFEEAFDDLFVDVQMKSVFADSKTFPDCVPLYPSSEILEKYRSSKDSADFDLKRFVAANFIIPGTTEENYKPELKASVVEHIEDLWPVLTREPDTAGGSLIPLPYRYVVPGGRFREVYYWDSYFTMLGLKASGQTDLIRSMIDNFAYLIDTIGFIPNGNRTYYLSRSQPPYFSLMVKLLAEIEGNSILVRYLPSLEKEYQFWMNGKEQLNVSQPAHRRVVRLKDGEVLNRYWDDKATPRTESYKEDVLLARKSERSPEDLYRNIRAACESGWDFSSRWFKDGKNLETIHTTEIIPVDLNGLLYHLELLIAKAHKIKGNEALQKKYLKLAEDRRKAVVKYCWDTKNRFFYDYDFMERKLKTINSLAGLSALYFQIASKDQAEAVAKIVREKFFMPGGVVTTLEKTGEQWDSPNGWPPLQWITTQGLQNYNHTDLAENIMEKWIRNNIRVYENTGRMVEKYNVKDITLLAGGGEYNLQDGFGWSNGVLLGFLEELKVKVNSEALELETTK